MSEISKEKYPYRVTHTGDNGCGRVAFYTKNKPNSENMAVRSVDCINLNGTKPKPHERIICGSCKKAIGQLHIKMVEER